MEKSLDYKGKDIFGAVLLGGLCFFVSFEQNCPH